MTSAREKELVQIAKNLTCNDPALILLASSEATAMTDLSELVFLRGITVGIRIGREAERDEAIMSLISIPGHTEVHSGL